MKTQILVTLEFEPGCQLMPGKTDWTHDALSVMTSPRALHLEVHEVLEAWQRTNPFWLQDPEALKVTSDLANDQAHRSAPTADGERKGNMNEPMTIEREKRGADSGAAPCSADHLRLSNDAKIRACNFFHAMQKHLGNCDECCLYLYHGDGDLCEAGKTILARELVYTDMGIEIPPTVPRTMAMMRPRSGLNRWRATWKRRRTIFSR